MFAPVSPPLSLAMVGIAPSGSSSSAWTIADGGRFAKEVFARAAALGFGDVQLNAGLPGLRARDLDRSARRDLGSTLRRSGLTCSGLDLFIPAEHFADPAQADRAVSSAVGAIEFAGELGESGGVGGGGAFGGVSLTIPATPGMGVLAALISAGERCGVPIADTAWPVREPPIAGLAVGLDPASVLASGGDPGSVASRLGARIALARLTDASRSLAGMRVVPGSRGGGLDILAYRIALVSAAPRASVVLDLRGVSTPLEEAGPAALRAWS